MTRNAKTIRNPNTSHNAKRVDHVFQNAGRVFKYSLDNQFQATAVPAEFWGTVRDKLSLRGASMSINMISGVADLHVHSNLWYKIFPQGM